MGIFRSMHATNGHHATRHHARTARRHIGSANSWTEGHTRWRQHWAASIEVCDIMPLPGGIIPGIMPGMPPPEPFIYTTLGVGTTHHSLGHVSVARRRRNPLRHAMATLSP